MVTHPFHPLVGRELPVLYSSRTRRGLLFVCEVEGGKRRIPLPQEWTDRGPEPRPERLGADGLAAMRDLIDAVTARARYVNRDGA